MHLGRYVATRQLSRTLSHAVPRIIFGDVEERERGERKRSLFAKQPPHELRFRTMRQQLHHYIYELLLSCNSQVYFKSMHKLRKYETT